MWLQYLGWFHMMLLLFLVKIVQKYRGCFLLLSISRAEEFDSGCWETHKSALLLSDFEWLHVERRRGGGLKADILEKKRRENDFINRAQASTRWCQVSQVLALVKHLDRRMSCRLPHLGSCKYSTDSKTTAPGEVWHHRSLLLSRLEPVIFLHSSAAFRGSRCLGGQLCWDLSFTLLNHETQLLFSRYISEIWNASIKPVAMQVQIVYKKSRRLHKHWFIY